MLCRPSLALALVLLAAGCSVTSDTELLLQPEDPADEPILGPCELLPGLEGDFIGQDLLVEASRAHCESALHATAGARGSTLRISLEDWDSDSPARLRVTDLLGQSLAELEGAEAGSSVQVLLDRSGEYLVHLEPTEPDAGANDYALSSTCTADCLEFTRYPIVFFHGMAGTDNFIGLMDYWYGVEPILTEAGYLNRMPPGGALASPADRAAQFSEALDAMEVEGIGRRFNLVGHSQGGIDARYLIGTLGQGPRIASLTTISAPHHGSPFADIVAATAFVDPALNYLVDEAVSQFTELLGLGPGELTDATEAMTTEAMEEFNATVPDSPDTTYYSWSGRTCGYSELLCQIDTNGEVVSPMFWASYQLVKLTSGPNDGLVPIDSAVWGEHLGVMPADHLDEVGLLFGMSGTFDHEDFYLTEARRLSDAGF